MESCSWLVVWYDGNENQFTIATFEPGLTAEQACDKFIEGKSLDPDQFDVIGMIDLEGKKLVKIYNPLRATLLQLNHAERFI